MLAGGAFQAKSKASASAKQKLKAEVGSSAGTNGSCPRVPGVGRGVMMGVYVQDLMRLDGGEISVQRTFRKAKGLQREGNAIGGQAGRGSVTLRNKNVTTFDVIHQGYVGLP